MFNSNRVIPRTMSNPGTLLSGIFRLTVDYRQSWEEMIAAGRYDWVHDNITSEHFPVTGDGIIEFEARYFIFNNFTSSEEVTRRIEATAWSRAKIEHMLSHGKTFPQEQREFPIVGLGSIATINGKNRTPVFIHPVSERYLSLDSVDTDWYPVCRFLSVRKIL